MNPYQYPAHLVEVVDGDTQDFVVDLGFNITKQIRVRLKHVDTHETYGVAHESEEYDKGKQETTFVESWLRNAADKHNGQWPLYITTEKKGKYGRYLATIQRKCDNEKLHVALLDTFDEIDA